MKLLRFVPALCFAIALFSPALLTAAETVRFDVVLYLFRSKSVAHMGFKSEAVTMMDFRKARSGKPPISGDGLVFTSPATLGFDNEELVLAGADYTWNGGRKVPARFSEASMPTIVAPFNQPTTLRVDVPTQYLEQVSDGRLQIRDIARDSADAPRYQVTLEAREVPVDSMGHDLMLLCETDISTIQSREKIPGVDLDVGKPVMVRFNQKVEFWSKKGQWSAVIAGQKESGDHVLLMLLKPSVVEPR